MKTPNLCLILTLHFLVQSPAFAQKISYAYDLAGNRISRTIILSEAPQKAPAEEQSEPFIEQFEQHEIKIFPNPTKGILIVEVNGGNTEDNVWLTLYNLQGMVLQQIEYVVGSPKQVNLSAYPVANYILRLHVGDKTVDYKIIKQ